MNNVQSYPKQVFSDVRFQYYFLASVEIMQVISAKIYRKDWTYSRLSHLRSHWVIIVIINSHQEWFISDILLKSHTFTQIYASCSSTIKQPIDSRSPEMEDISIWKPLVVIVVSICCYISSIWLQNSFLTIGAVCRNSSSNIPTSLQ